MHGARHTYYIINTYTLHGSGDLSPTIIMLRETVTQLKLDIIIMSDGYLSRICTLHCLDSQFVACHMHRQGYPPLKYEPTSVQGVVFQKLSPGVASQDIQMSYRQTDILGL